MLTYSILVYLALHCPHLLVTNGNQEANNNQSLTVNTSTRKNKLVTTNINTTTITTNKYADDLSTTVANDLFDLNNIGIDTETVDGEDATYGSTDGSTLPYPATEGPVNASNLSNITNSTSSVDNGKKLSLIPIKMNGFCYCDLTIEGCDVNCCCDSDCSSVDLELFTQCDDKTDIQFDPKYCHSNEFIYKTNSKWLFQKEINNMFCVVKQNIPPKRSIVDNKILTFSEASQKTLLFNSWITINQKNLIPSEVPKAKKYSLGDVIWLYTNKSLSPMGIPSNAINQYCSERSNLKFLVPMKSECLTKTADIDMFDIHKNLQDICIISKPQLFGNNCSLGFEDCKVMCAELEIEVCNESKCILQNANKPLQVESPVCNASLCRNMVKDVIFTFRCNHSDILKVFIKLIISNDIPKLYMEQKFRVKYYLLKENAVKPPIDVSGNPGYLVGNPLLVSKTPLNYSDLDQFFFDDSNASFFLNHHLIYPKNIKGRCVLNKLTHNVIKFNENFEANCKYEFKINDDNMTAEPTNLCKSLQENILDLVYCNQTQLYISSLGNPKHSSNQWIKIYSNVPYPEIEGETIGKSLLCRNFIKSLKYEFLYANDNIYDSKKHAILLSTIVNLNVQDYRFQIYDGKASTVIRFMSIFYDITKEPRYQYAKAPKLHIHLPEDFFYPFTMNSLGSVRCGTIYKLIISISLLNLLMNKL